MSAFVKDDGRYGGHSFLFNYPENKNGSGGF
jgi:hypothetical protein